MKKIRQDRIREHGNFWVTLIAGIVLTVILLLIPTGYEDAVIYQGAERAVVDVVSTDDSNIIVSGLVRTGEQTCQLYVREGMFKGRIITGVNFLSGSLESDTVFKPGDKAYVTISHDGDTVTRAIMTDHFRLGKEMVLVLIFLGVLVIFAGRQSVQTIFSFVITVLVIWKILVPCYLKGIDPLGLGIVIAAFLTVSIIFFVFGIDVRTLVASGGAMLGIGAAAVLGIIFTGWMNLHGAIMPASESLLYAGYQHLDLTRIYMAAIFLGASGSMMDLSVDITSAVWEVVEKKPSISRMEAIRSGMNVGRAAMGTQTSTLLLAYSGSYVTQMMVFMAQGTPIDHILNYRYVASEILHTVAGSFGLVTVAPFTAIVAGTVLPRYYRSRIQQKNTEMEKAE